MGAGASAADISNLSILGQELVKSTIASLSQEDRKKLTDAVNAKPDEDKSKEEPKAQECTREKDLQEAHRKPWPKQKEQPNPEKEYKDSYFTTKMRKDIPEEDANGATKEGKYGTHEDPKADVGHIFAKENGGANLEANAFMQDLHWNRAAGKNFDHWHAAFVGLDATKEAHQASMTNKEFQDGIWGKMTPEEIVAEGKTEMQRVGVLTKQGGGIDMRCEAYRNGDIKVDDNGMTTGLKEKLAEFKAIKQEEEQHKQQEKQQELEQRMAEERRREHAQSQEEHRRAEERRQEQERKKEEQRQREREQEAKRQQQIEEQRRREEREREEQRAREQRQREEQERRLQEQRRREQQMEEQRRGEERRQEEQRAREQRQREEEERRQQEQRRREAQDVGSGVFNSRGAEMSSNPMGRMTQSGRPDMRCNSNYVGGRRGW